MYGESKLLRSCGDFFNWFKTIAAPMRARRLCSVVNYAEAVDAVAFLAIPDTPYVRRPIRNCVWAVLMGQTNDDFPTVLYINLPVKPPEFGSK